MSQVLSKGFTHREMAHLLASHHLQTSERGDLQGGGWRGWRRWGRSTRLCSHAAHRSLPGPEATKSFTFSLNEAFNYDTNL